MATGYVTNYGNDANDGLTWETAKKTFQGAKDAGLNPVYAKGWFNEINPSVDNLYKNVESKKLGELILYGYNLPVLFYDGGGSHFPSIVNIIAYKADIIKNNYGSHCVFVNSIIFDIKTVSIAKAINTLFYKITNNSFYKYGITHSKSYNNTILSETLSFNDVGANLIQNSILYAALKLNIKFDIEYTLFISSKFMFTGGGLGTDETNYTYPTGATDYDKLQNLRNRMAAVYGGLPSDYLIGCKYYSRNAPDGQEEVEPYASAYKDIFVDADNGNFYLKEDSIAAHMAYDGSYVGAKPVGQQIALSDFSLTNIDANGKVTNQEIDSLAQRLNVTDLLKVRKILSWTALGERAARNGQQINTESNLGLPISAGAAVLTALKTYMVINDVITLDNAAATSYNPWETFQAIDEGGGAGLGFSTSTNGQVQEVLIDKYDEKITVKSSKDNPALTGANTLTFYLHEQPKVNLDANGIAIAGNADTTFDPATAVDFYMRYITLDVQIKANNLLAR